MKKALAVALSLSAAIASTARAQQPAAAPQAKPAMSQAAQQSMNVARYKVAITDARRKLFAAGMSDLAPNELQTFWGVYADYEKEKDAILAARTDLAKKYVDAYTSAAGITDADLTQIINEAGALQKKNTDLRLKYFGIYSQKLNVKAAARATLIDDYITTAVRLNLLDQLPMLGEEGKK